MLSDQKTYKKGREEPFLFIGHLFNLKKNALLVTRSR